MRSAGKRVVALKGFLVVSLGATSFAHLSFAQGNVKSPSNPDTARLVFYRPGKFVVAMGRPKIYLNRDLLGVLKNNEFIERQVSPGEVTVLSNKDIPEPRRVIAPPEVLTPRLESKRPSFGPCSAGNPPRDCIQELRNGNPENPGGRALLETPDAHRLYLCENANTPPLPHPYYYSHGVTGFFRSVSHVVDPTAGVVVTEFIPDRSTKEVTSDGTVQTAMRGRLNNDFISKARVDVNGETRTWVLSCTIFVNFLIADLTDDPSDWDEAGFHLIRFRAEAGKTYYFRRFYSIDNSHFEQVDPRLGEKETRHLKPAKFQTQTSGNP